ncbi:MAG: phosphate ABC transporter permease PstA [Chloroflexi bacterium]|nr:phosphate ABC transporter permease PstA [Chloroflexota bacterium]
MSRYAYPEKNDLDRFIAARYRTAWVWELLFFSSLLIALTALTALFASVIDDAFGYVAYEYKKDPATVSDKPLEELNKEELIAVLQANLSRGAYGKLDNEQPMQARSEGELYNLIIERIIQVKTRETYTLSRSLFDKAGIEAEVKENFPEAKLEFRSWLTPLFLTSPQSSKAEFAGVRTAILGSLWIVGIAIVLALPTGVGAAVYLQEYANKKNIIAKIIQTNINNLAGVPSIVYGMLGLAIFVRAWEPFTSGAMFGVTDTNGRTVLSAGLTMGILVLPLVIINAQEAIKAVPDSLRQAAYGVGATRWQMVWHHILPAALPGILTGSILAMSRAIGETAPLIIVGASTFITMDPSSPFTKFTALPIQIYQWTSRAQGEFHAIAAAGILVLAGLLLMLNATAILLRNRYQRRW